MQRVIIVVSPDTEFLQQLRSHLEEGGRYQVTVALSAHEALNLANSNFFEVAILDGELDDIPVAAFTRDLAALQSDLKILVFPPDNNPQHPVLEGLVANGFLSKPFSGQEIGKALSSLFSDQPMTGGVQVKVIDDLVKQWLQIPETGGRKAEQILEATSSQTVLIVIKDQLIASAGSMDDGLDTNVTGFLSRYWKDEENSELARYIKLDGDGSERFLYATKLVSNVVLVLVYPMNTTIQLVRRELNNVKDDFQQHYPTTGELRQDIAKQALADINERNKKLEALQPNTSTVSQNELDILKQLNQAPAKPNTSAISQEEIDLLKALQQEPPKAAAESVSQAELEARKLFEQESLISKPKPNISTVSQEEIDLLKALQQEPPKAAANSVSQAELEARKLFEQESLISKPKPNISTISQEEIDLLKALQQETPKPAADSIPQAELEARKLFEQESLISKPKPNISTISQEEIDLLKALQQETPKPAADSVSQAELEARKLFEQESLISKPKPNISTISQEEIDLLNALHQEPQKPAADSISQAELDARKLFEQESVKPKPIATINSISQEEIDLLKALQEQAPKPSGNPPTQAELNARKLFEQESLNKAVQTKNDVSQSDLDALKLIENDSIKPATVNTPEISEQELANLSKLLEQMPAPDPQPETEGAVEEKKLPEWLNELETAENVVHSTSPQPLPTVQSIPTGTPPFLGIDASLKLAQETSEPLPEIDFKLPWEMEETPIEAAVQAPAEQTAVSIPEPISEPATENTTDVVEPEIKPVVETPVAALVETPIEALQPPAASFAEVLSAVIPQVDNSPMPAVVEPAVTPVSEPAAVQEPAAPPAPPSLKDFRFNYTLVLMPGDHNQFLARNLSEKLSTIMPDIHEDQGWKMTSITVRPQYLLWTVAVTMGTCPNRIIQEVRQLTSNSIFANFPEIAKIKTSNDFWSSKYLAVSGSEPPPVNLIFDFVSNAWKTPELATP